MNYWKDLQVFCWNNKLDPHGADTQRAFRRHELGLPWRIARKVDDDDKLSWVDIEQLTRGRGGRSYAPCPHCNHGSTCEIDRSASQATWHCHYCGRGGTTLNSGEQLNQEALRQYDEEEKAEKVTRALKLFDQATSIKNDSDPAVYMRARGLELPPNADAVMRWHPRCDFGRDKLGCIVCLFRDAITDQPTGIQRTYLYSPMHGKSQRMALGKIAGSAIKLWPLGDSEDLAVGEGIETVLAAVKLGAAAPPAWALCVANNLTKLPVITGVRQLTILADNDLTKTGEKVARKLRAVWLDTNREVRLRMPPEGKDFNDLLRRRS